MSEWEAAHKEIKDAAKAAEQANNAVGGLHDYVDGAFADGIITEAEAKAIESISIRLIMLKLRLKLLITNYTRMFIYPVPPKRVY